MSRAGWRALGAEGLGSYKIVAVLDYPVKKGGEELRERITLRDSPYAELETSYSDRCKEITASYTLMHRDASSSMLGDNLALRLLTPLNIHHGEDKVKHLQSLYLRRITRAVSDQVINDYELAATNIRLHPLFFLLQWLKPKLALMPSLARLFWWLDPTAKEYEKYLVQVVSVMQEALREAARGDLLVEIEGLYSVNPSKVLQRRLARTNLRVKLPFNSQVVRVIREPRAALGALRLILSEVQIDETAWQIDLNPEAWAFIQTARGLQPLSSDAPLIEALKEHLSLTGVEFRIDKRGSILNSTYIIRVYDDSGLKDSLFVKKYFSWTDIKWLATKLWVMPMRNFYLSPATRMSNEIYFLNYLGERGFKVPHIVYVSWAARALVENALDGFNLTEAWTKNRERLGNVDLEKYTIDVGRTLAKVHRAGVVVGDCKSDNFIVSPPSIWLVDLEQAALKGSQSWDLAELILYMGHYLEPDKAERYASLVTIGYLSEGSIEVVEGILDGRFQLTMLPWTPIWTQAWMIRAVERELRR
ncbi:MAG: lipopolysaccharide kinase InaA family protein [Nitrososphaerota archaeon]